MRARGILLPWLGAIAGAIGWAVSHQLASNSIFDDCTRADGGFVLLVCAPALLIAIGGGIASFSVWTGGPGEGEARRFLGLLSALVAALAAFAIILQALSPLILSACAT
jgi:hypothetical protein